MSRLVFTFDLPISRLYAAIRLRDFFPRIFRVFAFCPSARFFGSFCFRFRSCFARNLVRCQINGLGLSPRTRMRGVGQWFRVKETHSPERKYEEYFEKSIDSPRRPRGTIGSIEKRPGLGRSRAICSWRDSAMGPYARRRRPVILS